MYIKYILDIYSKYMFDTIFNLALLEHRRNACEAAGLVTRVVASLTTCMIQSSLNSPYKLSLIDTLW